MYTRIVKFTGMMILAVAMMAGAVSAQEGNGGNLAPVGFYTGVESSTGTEDPASRVRYGNTFVLTSHGEWDTHHLSVSVNYSADQLIPDNYTVAGGTWSLVVSRDNVYAGTLYGTVSGGNLFFTTNTAGEELKEVSINLISTGGSGEFAGKSGINIPCEYSASTNLRTGETNGSANFRF